MKTEHLGRKFKSILALSIMLMGSAGMAEAACQDSRLSSSAYSSIASSNTTLAAVSAILGCSPSTTQTTDALGRAITIAAWSSDHKVIQVTFLDRTGVSLEKTASNLNWSLPAAPGNTMVSSTGIMSLPVLTLSDGTFGTSTTLYDVAVQLNPNGRWSLIRSADSVPTQSGTTDPLWDPAGAAAASYNNNTRVLSVPTLVVDGATTYQQVSISLSSTGWHIDSAIVGGVFKNDPSILSNPAKASTSAPDITLDRTTGILTVPILVVTKNDTLCPSGLCSMQIQGGQIPAMYYDAKLMLSENGTWSLMSLSETIPLRTDVVNEEPAWIPDADSTGTFNVDSGLLTLPMAVVSGTGGLALVPGIAPSIISTTTTAYQVGILLRGSLWQVVSSVSSNGTVTTNPVESSQYTTVTGTITGFVGGEEGTVFSLGTSRYRMKAGCSFPHPDATATTSSSTFSSATNVTATTTTNAVTTTTSCIAPVAPATAYTCTTETKTRGIPYNPSATVYSTADITATSSYERFVTIEGSTATCPVEKME